MDWKKTTEASLKDVKSIQEIIKSLQEVRDLVARQVEADMTSIAEAEAQKKKLESGRVE